MALTVMVASCGSLSPGSRASGSMGDATPPARPAPPASPQADPSADARTLQAYEWDLRTAFDAQGRPAADWQLPSRAPLRLVFGADRLAVQNLCNVLGAGYTLAGPRIQVGRPVATMKACAEPGLMALERRAAERLPQAERYALRQPNSQWLLTLHFADGTRWELAGTPTAATRYGSAGETVFLEVAPQRVRCNHPLMRDAMCLQVRDVRYDARGIRLQPPGEWRIFQGDIEGYTHQPGTRNVLRVKRYSLARNGQLPADAPSHAYVLDMTVESARGR